MSITKQIIFISIFTTLSTPSFSSAVNVTPPTQGKPTADVKTTKIEATKPVILLTTQFNITDEAVLDWGKNIAPKIRTYNFVKMRDQFSEIAKYFIAKPWIKYFDRSPGWDEYYHSLEKEMHDVREQRLFVVAKLDGKPILLNKFVKENTNFWEVQIPLKVTYISINGEVKKAIKMNMLLTTCPNPLRLCIDRFYETKRK